MKTLPQFWWLMILMAGLIFTTQFKGFCDEAVDGNLLPNPSFEKGDKLPTGWTTWQGGDCCTFVWDRANAHSGQSSLYLCNADKEGMLAWSASCELRENTSYRFSVWVKIIKGKNSNGAVLARIRSPIKGMRERWQLGGESIGNTDGQWKQIQWDFKTPPGIIKPVISLTSVSGRGDQVWFDDVEIKEIPK